MAAQTKEEFARLLTEGVYRIKLHETKSLQIIQDQLGYAIGREGGSAVEHWRRGNIPAKIEDLESLAGEIVRRGRLDRQWLEQFLMHGQHPSPTQLANDLFLPNSPKETIAIIHSPSSNLPGKNYRKLVGRDELIDNIGAALRDKNGRWLVGIDGPGGIGKTALARDVADYCQERCPFETILWVSASRSDLPGATVPDGGLTFERLLDVIGTQLGIADVAKLKLPQKEQQIQLLMREQALLLILDNLETAVEPQADIVNRLGSLLNPSKALLTSRHRFRGDVYTIRLSGLADEGATKFIHQDATEKGIRHVEMSSPQELAPIIEATGGSPLALKLVISQLEYFAPEIVLQNLTEVASQSSSETEFTRLYKHIYGRSWSLLSQKSQELLLAMSYFAPGLGGSFEAIKDISNLAHADLVNSIDTLWQLSFLEVGDTARLNQIRYYLHPLTQYFVLSDIMHVL